MVHLRADLLEGKFDDLLSSLPEEMVGTYKKQAVALLSEEHLNMKLETELGNTEEYITDPVEGFPHILLPKVS